MNSDGVGEAGNVAGGIGVAVGIAICVSAAAVLTVDMAVSITFAGLVVGVDMKILQETSIAGVRKKGINDLPKIFTFHLPLMFCVRGLAQWAVALGCRRLLDVTAESSAFIACSVNPYSYFSPTPIENSIILLNPSCHH